MIVALAISFSATVQAKAPDIFDELWRTPYDWVESPNERRGGWSGASKITLSGEKAVEMPCILKKLQNHSYYLVRNGFVPRPTFERKARNLRYLKEVGIGVPEVFYYGRRKGPGRDQSLLLILELVDYQPLTSIFNADVSRDLTDRTAVAAAIGKAVRRLHYGVIGMSFINTSSSRSTLMTSMCA
jgi:hypothetical protein